MSTEQMQAVVYHGDGQARVGPWPKPQVQPGHMLLRVLAAALNRRDVWIITGKYPGMKPPVVLGSDALAVVEAVGDGVDAHWLGRRVVVNPSLGWGTNPAHQGSDFEILGNPRDGSFAQWLAVPSQAVHAAPEHCSDHQAAALPLAGLTAYRALFTRAQAQANERVLITGIGGGVAQIALSMAVAAGCRVAVTSGDAHKRQAAQALGASWAGDYRDPNWAQNLKQEWGGVDVVIDGTAGPGLVQCLEVADYGARIAIYGGTAGAVDGIPPRVFFWKQLNVLGTTMGSDNDFHAMLDFVSRHQVQISVDQVFPLEQWPQALDRLQAGKQLGKVVLQVGDASE